MITVGRYLLKRCLIDNSLLEHTNWIDFTSRDNHNFNSVQCFVEAFPSLNYVDDKLQSQLLKVYLWYKALDVQLMNFLFEEKIMFCS